jgi:hypothetical protein
LSKNIIAPRSYNQPEEDGTQKKHKIISLKAKPTQKIEKRHTTGSDTKVTNSIPITNQTNESSPLLPEQTAPLIPSGRYGPVHGSSQVPIAGALFVATCLGTPVIALTGLKLGMFAAMGGGIMGFATGKMFAEDE